MLFHTIQGLVSSALSTGMLSNELLLDEKGDQGQA